MLHCITLARSLSFGLPFFSPPGLFSGYEKRVARNCICQCNTYHKCGLFVDSQPCIEAAHGALEMERKLWCGTKFLFFAYAVCTEKFSKG